MMNLNDITLDHPDATETIRLAKEHGLVLLPTYLDAEALGALNAEFEMAMEQADKASGISAMDYSEGRAAKVQLAKGAGTHLPITEQVFTDRFMQEVMEGYLGSKGELNSDIFVVNDVVGSAHHANDMHFDVVPTFKFFLYLTDTTTENGAFTVVLDSYQKTQAIRKRHGSRVSYKNRHLSRELDFTEEQVVPVEGKAGTLIIFDTDVWHRAGVISQGERRVMRGHCRTPDVNSLWNRLLRKIRP